MNLCAPALIYIAFSLIQIIIDTFTGLYNTALFKFIVMVIITILLNALCQSGMGIISWIIVFVPFIFMSVIVTILLFVFGLDPKTGKLTQTQHLTPSNLIYSSNRDVSFLDNHLEEEHVEEPNIPTNWTSDPQYS
jgi:amino acid transporter